MTKFITVLKVPPERFNFIVNVCEDITKKDPSFHYEARSLQGVIWVFSEDKDKAFRRGGWFWRKQQIRYSVKEAQSKTIISDVNSDSSDLNNSTKDEWK